MPQEFKHACQFYSNTENQVSKLNQFNFICLESIYPSSTQTSFAQYGALGSIFNEKLD